MILSDYRLRFVEPEPAKEVVDSAPAANTEEVCTGVIVDDTNPEEDEDDEDLELSPMDEEDFEEMLTTLKETFVFLDDMVVGFLKDDVKMPDDLIKRLEVVVGNIHYYVNLYEPFKPELAGEPVLIKEAKPEGV